MTFDEWQAVSNLDSQVVLSDALAEHVWEHSWEELLKPLLDSGPREFVADGITIIERQLPVEDELDENSQESSKEILE